LYRCGNAAAVSLVWSGKPGGGLINGLLAGENGCISGEKKKIIVQRGRREREREGELHRYAGTLD